MNFLTRLLISVYSRMLHLYPRRFREEFAEEMQIVFEDSVDEAVRDGILPLATLSLRDLGGLPFNILREFWHEYQGKELSMFHENDLSAPVSMGQAMGGILPFFMFGIFLILLELPISLLESDWFISIAGVFLGGLLIMPAVGFGIGWIRNFPRWSYPYTGIALIAALYIQNASTPGLRFFGIPIFGRELWGWRSWIPLAVVFVIALAISRSFKPFTRFFVNLWQDWSIPSYLMAGALPFLVMIMFDEMDHAYTLYFVIPFAVVMVGMAFFYLRSQTTWQRVLALSLGVVVIVFPAVLGSSLYWQANNAITLSGAQSMLLSAGKVSLIMLLPAWLEWLRHSMRRLRTA